MQAPAKDCPKCSSTMAVRLGEYECTDCGYFEPIVGGAKPQRLPRLTADDIAADSRQARSSLVQPRAQNHSAKLLTAEKILFLTLSFIALAASNILMRAEYKQVFSLELPLRHIFIGAVVLVLAAAVLLFIDWRALKGFAIALIVILLGSYAFSLIASWEGKSQLILIKLAIDMVLICWLLALLIRDLRRS